jgi:hypothetical protein
MGYHADLSNIYNFSMKHLFISYSTPQPVKKLFISYAIWRLLLYATTHQWVISWARRIKLTLSHSNSLRSTLTVKTITVGIVRLRTKTTKFSFFCFILVQNNFHFMKWKVPRLGNKKWWLNLLNFGYHLLQNSFFGTYIFSQASQNITVILRVDYSITVSLGSSIATIVALFLDPNHKTDFHHPFWSQR